jgi:hypothetical protein
VSANHFTPTPEQPFNLRYMKSPAPARQEPPQRWPRYPITKQMLMIGPHHRRPWQEPPPKVA